MSIFSFFKQKNVKKTAKQSVERTVSQSGALTPRTYRNVEAQGNQRSPEYQPLYDFEYKFLPSAMERKTVAESALSHRLNAGYFLPMSNYIFNTYNMKNPLTEESFKVEYAQFGNVLICYVDIDYPVERVLAHALIFTVKINRSGNLTPKLFFVENDMFSKSPMIGSMTNGMHANYGTAGCEKTDIVAKVVEIVSGQ